MQNLDQTQIFYIVGQTHLTLAKRDLGDPPGFNPESHSYLDIACL